MERENTHEELVKKTDAKQTQQGVFMRMCKRQKRTFWHERAERTYSSSHILTHLFQLNKVFVIYRLVCIFAVCMVSPLSHSFSSLFFFCVSLFVSCSLYLSLSPFSFLFLLLIFAIPISCNSLHDFCNQSHNNCLITCKVKSSICNVVIPLELFQTFSLNSAD